MEDIKLNLSEAEIKAMSKYRYKNIVKQKIATLAILDLESRKKQKSMKLKITRFVPQEYILSKNFSISEVQALFKIRNNMVEVKENYKSSFDNEWCRLCLVSRETQRHLLDSIKVREKLRGVVNFENLTIEMAYQSIDNQELVAKTNNIVINTWKDLISLPGNQ